MRSLEQLQSMAALALSCRFYLVEAVECVPYLERIRFTRLVQQRDAAVLSCNVRLNVYQKAVLEKLGPDKQFQPDFDLSGTGTVNEYKSEIPHFLRVVLVSHPRMIKVFDESVPLSLESIQQYLISQQLEWQQTLDCSLRLYNCLVKCEGLRSELCSSLSSVEELVNTLSTPLSSDVVHHDSVCAHVSHGKLSKPLSLDLAIFPLEP